MSYLNTKQVKKFAKKLHKMQRLKNGKKYFGHLLRVAEFAETQFFKEMGTAILSATHLDTLEKIKQAAYLHDSLEDRCTEEVLVISRIDPEVVDAVSLLTKRPIAYSDETYLAHVYNNFYARIVKMADLQHNSLLSRLAPNDSFEKLAERQNKYLRQYLFLETGKWP